MSKYGTSRFGSGFKYGEVSAISVYYSSNIRAVLTDYGTVTVSWSRFASDPNDGTLTHWKLVKSYSGSLDNPDDAMYIAGGAYSSFTTATQDVFTDAFGVEINYSLWVFNGLKWIACGNAYVVNAVDTGTLNMITKWVPRAWLNGSATTVGDAAGEYEKGDFLSILKAYALTYDIFRSEANLLSLSMNKAYTHHSILRAKLSEYGFNVEPVLGDSYHRSLVGAGNIISSYKGTNTGLVAFVTGLTHWPAKIISGTNLMNDYNDSSFEESVGNWAASSGTFAAKTFAGESVTAPSAATVMYDQTYGPRVVGFGQLTTTATTAVTLSLPASNSDMTLYGIPVKPNTRYIFTGQVAHRDSNNATITAVISWYDAFGTLIATTSAPTATTTTTSWAEFKSISDSGRNGKQSPSNAAYASITLTVTPSSATSSRFMLDMLQLAEYIHSFEFQDAKRVQIAVAGDKENYANNASFEAGAHSWSAYHGTLRIDTSSTLGLTFRSSASPEVSSLVLTATGSGASYVSDWIPVEEGQTVTASCYVMGSAARQAAIKIEYSTQDSEAGQTSILNDVTYGQYYPMTTNAVTSSFGATTVTNVTSDGTTITYTADNTFIAGQTVNVTGLSPADFNLTNATIASATSTQFTVTSGTYGIYDSDGTASVISTTLSTSTASQISVTSIVPPYTKDAGYPIAKVTIYFPDSVNADVFYMDGFQLEENSTATPFFCGGGGLIPSSPVTSQFYSVNDTRWETRNKFNYVSNPSFEAGTVGSAPTDWTSTGTITKVSSDAGTTPLFNTYFAKVAFTTGATVTGNYYLPYAAQGGEDFTISAYVKGAAATYTISSSGTYVVTSAESSKWTRINTTIKLAAGATSGTFTIGIAATSATVFYIDGVQAEYGRRVSKFVDPLDSLTTTTTNPITAGKTYISTQSENTGGSKSTWLYNYPVKSARLKSTVGNYIPNGTSWAIKTGYPTDKYRDLTESLIPNNSFETTLGDWTGTNSTLTRVVATGSTIGDVVTSGQAYAAVTTAGSSGNIPFKIVSPRVYISPDGGYYASAAIRPANSNSAVSYTLEVQFYDNNNTLIPVYTDNVTGQYTSNKYDGTGTLNSVTSTTAARTVTKSITALDRWSYISKTFSAGSIQGAVSAILTITCTPTTYASGQAFHVDRVVFRQ